MARLIVLVEGRSWVEIRPIGGSLGRVMGGTAHPVDNLVVLPDSVDNWSTAAEADANGDTRVRPRDLKTLYESSTDAYCIPEIECVLPALRAEIAIPGGLDLRTVVASRR